MLHGCYVSLCGSIRDTRTGGFDTYNLLKATNSTTPYQTQDSTRKASILRSGAKQRLRSGKALGFVAMGQSWRCCGGGAFGMAQMGKQVQYGRVGVLGGVVLWISGSWVLQWARLVEWQVGQASGYQKVWRIAAFWVQGPGSWMVQYRVWAVQLQLRGCWDVEMRELPRQCGLGIQLFCGIQGYRRGRI